MPVRVDCIPIRRGMGKGGVGRAAPGTRNCNGNCSGNSVHSVGWRGGSGCGGRRKPVLGGLAAASMPRTPPQPDPPRLRQFSAICRDGSWGQIRFPTENGSDPRVMSISDRDSSTHEVDPSDAGNLSEVGRCRSAGCQPYGPEACLGRAGQDAQPRSCRVRRTAHTSKRLPSLQGRTCGVPALRHRPAIPRNAALAVASAVAVAVA